MQTTHLGVLFEELRGKQYSEPTNDPQWGGFCVHSGCLLSKSSLDKPPLSRDSSLS